MYEKDPVISVIMGIYNCGDTLSEAINIALDMEGGQSDEKDHG